MEKREWIIELTKDLRNEAEASQDEPERWKKRSIYKVPFHAVNLNKDAYTPWVVAIGPYHHEDAHVQRMEEHKKRALRHFLLRSKKPLESFVEALVDVVDDLMDAYGHLDEDWKQDARKFLHLMIVDGCFVLETMRAAHKTMADYNRNDLIFSKHGKKNAIPCFRRDMLLLENQVPLLVLERLLAVESDRNIEESEREVIALVLKLYGLNGNSSQIGECQHILDVYRKSQILGVKKDNPKYTTKRRVDEGTVHSATEMQEAGIKFKKSTSKILIDISFTSRTLKLPEISLDDTSESAFLNMVAFERFQVDAGNEISSYIFFMNRVVSDVRDVRLLKSRGIISSALGSDEDVAKLFLNLSKEILLDSDSWLAQVYSNIDQQLGKHLRKTLFKWRYHLIHTYFSSPWALVSVVAAAFGLGLSMTQLLYAIFSYINDRKAPSSSPGRHGKFGF